MKTMKIRRLAFAMLAAMLSLASCSSDDDYKFDASKLEGKWRKAIRSGIMDGETVIPYTFYSGELVFWSHRAASFCMAR